jgi:hypothetical protein
LRIKDLEATIMRIGEDKDKVSYELESKENMMHGELQELQEKLMQRETELSESIFVI